MSLRWCRMPRLVVLSPSDPVLDAARAIENNNIGAVIVQDQGRVVGIATDRDLAVRLVSPGQIKDVRDQLPEDMRSILSEPVPVGS